MAFKIDRLQYWTKKIPYWILLSFSFSALADDNYFTATYKGKLSGFSVTTTRTLSHTHGDQFQLSSKAKNRFASIAEESWFTKKEKQFIPQKYTYNRKIIGMKSKQHITFDWNTLKAEYIREDKPKKNTSHELEIGLLDPSLYQLKLQKDLNLGNDTFKYRFPKEWKIKTMEFKVSGKTQFKLAKKHYDAIELKRINQPDKKRTQIIVIPELLFQIAKITHIEEDGKQYALTLQDFKFDNKKLSAFYLNSPAQTVKANPITDTVK